MGDPSWQNRLVPFWSIITVVHVPEVTIDSLEPCSFVIDGYGYSMSVKKSDLSTYTHPRVVATLYPPIPPFLPHEHLWVCIYIEF